MFARRTTAESIVIHEILHTLGVLSYMSVDMPRTANLRFVNDTATLMGQDSLCSEKSPSRRNFG